MYIKVGSFNLAKLCNFIINEMKSLAYCYRVVDLFIFSHGGNWNKQGGSVTLMWLVALASVILVLSNLEVSREKRT